MICVLTRISLSSVRSASCCQCRQIHCSSIAAQKKKLSPTVAAHKTKLIKQHGMKWRISQGMSRSGNEYGLLTDMPDYSFIDGRPTPLTFRQQDRRQNRIDTASDIMEKLGQIDFAKGRFQQNEKAKQEERHTILTQKLKSKS